MSENKFQVQPVFKFGDWVQEEGSSPFVVHYICCKDGSYLYTDMIHKPWHKEPSLKLIERPKKKVTKTMYQAILHDRGMTATFVSQLLFNDEDDARQQNPKTFIALGPAITFKVEE